MTKVILDVRGRLLEFQAVPPQVKDKTAQPSEPDWVTLFGEAGLDIRNYRQTESNWTPPFFADAHMSWEGPHVDHAEIPVRIEAAAYQGKPVYFQIVAPWDKPLRQEETVLRSQRRVAVAIAIPVVLTVIIAAVFLARRNLRQGRSDFRKQWLATAVFWILLFSVTSLTFGRGSNWAGLLGVALITTIAVVGLARFGLLAMISRAVFVELSALNAITADFSSWYFGNTIFSAVVLFGLAIYGFYTSLAGQPFLKGKLLED